MIAYLVKLTGLSDWIIELIIVGLLVIALLFGLNRIYSLGYASGAADEKVKTAQAVQAETNRQAIVNRQAQEAMAQTIGQLRADNEILQTTLKDNDTAADAAVDRDTISLGADSVRRHNLLIRRSASKPSGAGQRDN